MSEHTARQVREFYAQTYDVVVPDWPGEIEFYRGLAAQARADGQAVLEVACGTGRVAIRLAQEGGRSSASISRRPCSTWPGPRAPAWTTCTGCRAT